MVLEKKAVAVRQVVGRAKKRQLAIMSVNTHKYTTVGVTLPGALEPPTNTALLCISSCKHPEILHWQTEVSDCRQFSQN